MTHAIFAEVGVYCQITSTGLAHRHRIVHRRNSSAHLAVKEMSSLLLSCKHESEYVTCARQADERPAATAARVFFTPTRTYLRRQVRRGDVVDDEVNAVHYPFRRVHQRQRLLGLRHKDVHVGCPQTAGRLGLS